MDTSWWITPERWDNHVKIPAELLISLQIVFLGEIGSGYRSDIGLDDIEVEGGACETPDGGK